MDTDTIIRHLEYEADRHKNDRLFTGQVNITAMCRDLIPKMKELKRYEDLAQNGRLLELPCKVGDTLYVLDRDNKSREMILDSPDVRCHCAKEDNLCMGLCDNKNFGVCAYRMMNDGTDIGKRVFLTQEAAEAALKEMEGQA